MLLDHLEGILNYSAQELESALPCQAAGGRRRGS